MGERYRREMLAHGGAKEPMLMVEGKLQCPMSYLPIQFNEALYFLTSSFQNICITSDFSLVRHYFRLSADLLTPQPSGKSRLTVYRADLVCLYHSLTVLGFPRVHLQVSVCLGSFQ